MSVGSGLASARQPTPELAAEAVRKALQAAGLQRADQVLLFLSRDFMRHAPPAIIAAARTAGCLEIAGCTASGLFTERGSLLDQAGAAALVLSGMSPGENASAMPTLCFSGQPSLPFAWQTGIARAGLLDADAQTWAHARLQNDEGCAIGLPGGQIELALSTGLRPLSDALPVERSDAYELRRVAGQSAVDSLQRSLPASLRQTMSVHQIAILRQADEPAIAILSSNADGSLTLAEALTVGENIRWAVRQPLAAEQDMRQALAATTIGAPDFGLMLSCIGRGPLFYGGEDRDRLAFCEQFPDTPLLGIYGNGQIAPAGGMNRLFHNSVITLLFEGAHV